MKFDSKIKELKKVPHLYEFIMEHGFLAGGAIRDIIRKATPKDYDIFFKTVAAKDEFIEKFGDKMEVTGIGNYNWKDFQFITIRTGSPKKILDTFDWNVNQVAYDFKAKRSEGYWGDDIYLRFNTKTDKPLASLLRLPYLISKGYTIDEKEYLFALAYTATTVDLTSSQAVESQYEFMSSGGGQTSPSGIVERAAELANAEKLRKSPLSQALS